MMGIGVQQHLEDHKLPIPSELDGLIFLPSVGQLPLFLAPSPGALVTELRQLSP